MGDREAQRDAQRRMDTAARGGRYRIGVDLGGTKIEAALMSPDGEIVETRRVPTPQGDYSGTLAAIRELVGALEVSLAAPARVGVGMPGAMSPHTGTVQNANSVVLNQRALDSDLSALLERPVRLANDADCFALSEATDGAAAGAGTVFGVILGTGVGGGVVVRGQLLAGPNAIAGEWGHNPLPGSEVEGASAPMCWCGRRGCIETYLSGPGMAADFWRAENASKTMLEVAGQAGVIEKRSPDAEQILRLAETGHAGALQCVNRYIDRLARALSMVINILDPDVIVLGGGLSNISRLYEDVPARWSDIIFAPAVRTRLVPPAYGDASGVRGAAWLWPAEE